MEQNYTQCRLSAGTKRTVSWIPSHIAKVGQVVELREGRQDDPEIWTVDETFDTISSDMLVDKQKADKNSLPSIRPKKTKKTE